MKVEELEMLYAEFCLGTRATEEPSVTCRQRWHGQAVTLGYAHEEQAGRSQPRRDEDALHPIPGTPISSKGDLNIYLCNTLGAQGTTGMQQKLRHENGKARSEQGAASES